MIQRVCVVVTVTKNEVITHLWHVVAGIYSGAFGVYPTDLAFVEASTLRKKLVNIAFVLNDISC